VEEKLEEQKMANELDKFKRHMACAQTLVLKNDDGTEDTFEFKPLSVEVFTEFMVISEELDKKPEADAAKAMFDLYVRIIQNSYPELNKLDAESFLISNFADMMELMQNLMPVKLDQQQTKEMKQKLEQMRVANASSSGSDSK
jgi:hypothetical protein